MQTYSMRITVEVESNGTAEDSRKCDIVLTSVSGYAGSVSEALGRLAHEVADMLYTNLREESAE